MFMRLSILGRLDLKQTSWNILSEKDIDAEWFIHSFKKKSIYLIYTLRIRKESRSTWFNMMKSWNITVKNRVQTSCIMKKIINSRNKEYRISGTIHISSLIISIIFEQQYQTSANNHARKCSYEICLRKLATNRIPPPRLEQQFERV